MTVGESLLLFSPVIALMAVLFVALWLTRAKRNRRTGMGRPYRDDRSSIEQFNRIMGKL